MINFTDTHCHIDDSAFEQDIDSIIHQAKEAGINKLIVPGIDKTNQNKIDMLSQKFPNIVFPCIGLHPTSISNGYNEELKFVFDNFDKNKYYAIGEIGLDAYWSKDFLSEQEICLKQQIDFAIQNRLPIILHSRDSTLLLINTLKLFDRKKISGVFHSFGGSYETYLEQKKLGNFKFGIGGIITYKNSNLAYTINKMNLEDILLETDSPWLSPVPFRGKRNEPKYIIDIAKKICEIKNCNLEELSIFTQNSVKQIFNL